jgi:hypothetical protein
MVPPSDNNPFYREIPPPDQAEEEMNESMVEPIKNKALYS